MMPKKSVLPMFTAIWKTSLACAFLILFSCMNRTDPRLVSNHDSWLFLNSDTLKLNVLRLPIIKGDTIRQGKKEYLSQAQMKFIVEDLLGKPFNYTLVSADLYAGYNQTTPLRKWTINNEDISHLSVFYIRNDSLIFDLYNIRTNTSHSYTHLSNAYCDIPFMFLMKERELHSDNIALVSLTLKPSELPNANDIILCKKEDDSLYKAEKLYFSTDNNP